jgi:hypothetical protein
MPAAHSCPAPPRHCSHPPQLPSRHPSQPPRLQQHLGHQSGGCCGSRAHSRPRSSQSSRRSRARSSSRLPLTCAQQHLLPACLALPPRSPQALHTLQPLALHQPPHSQSAPMMQQPAAGTRNPAPARQRCTCSRGACTITGSAPAAPTGSHHQQLITRSTPATTCDHASSIRV